MPAEISWICKDCSANWILFGADFLRIGPVKRMDKALLAYSLHCSGSRSSEAMKELNDMLSASTDAVEQLAIQKEIGELQQVSCIACMPTVALRSHPCSALLTDNIHLTSKATLTFRLRQHHARQMQMS